MPEICENCGVEGRLAPVGPGVERLAEEAKAVFPDANIAVLSSDLFSSARSLKSAITEILPHGIETQTPRHHRVSREVAIKEPKVRVDIELGHNNALTCFTTITVNLTDTV